MRKVETLQLWPKKALYDHVLFLDGLGRAGKFLLSKICSNFERIEYFQFVESLEHIPILNSLNLVEKSAAISMMQIILDSSIYGLAIGRGLNLRKKDSSSILHATNYKKYLDRAENKDGINAIFKLKKLNRLPSFVIHECLPHINFLLEVFPYLQMIHIQRHPIDLSYSWLHRGWGKRYGVDPLAFKPTIKNNKGPAPWFTRNWKQDYMEMSEADRVINSICTLQNLTFQSYGKLNKRMKKKILILSYEDFFSIPNLVINKLSTFLKSRPLPNMKEILEREGCPKEIPISSRITKFEELVKISTPNSIKELAECSKKYDSLWNLESFT